MEGVLAVERGDGRGNEEGFILSSNIVPHQPYDTLQRTGSVTFFLHLFSTWSAMPKTLLSRYNSPYGWTSGQPLPLSPQEFLPRSTIVAVHKWKETKSLGGPALLGVREINVQES